MTLAMMELFISCKSLSRIALFSFVFVVVLHSVILEKSDKKASDDTKDKWKKKDIRDYTDADVERLYDQWEEADEPLEEDELPEWKKPQPKIDLSQLDPNDPEGMLKMSKQGRTLMMFATVSGNPSEKETETITQLWQSSLFNAHYDAQRYVVGSNRVLFLLKDGAKAWEVKDFLVRQERCEVVTIEGKDYPGRGSQGSEDKDNSDDNKSSKKSSKSKKDKDGGKADKKSKSKSGVGNAGQKDSQTTIRDDQPREDL